jgi:hypothetical protein
LIVTATVGGNAAKVLKLWVQVLDAIDPIPESQKTERRCRKIKGIERQVPWREH